MNAITDMSDYSWLDFVEEFTTTKFGSELEMYKAVAKKLPIVASFVTLDNGFYVKKNDLDDGLFNICKALSPNIPISYEIKLRTESKLKTTTLKKLIASHPELLPLYNKFVFKPNLNTVKPGELNLWRGFEGKEISNPSTDGVFAKDITDRFEHYIRSIWCNNDEVVGEYVLDWLSHVIQKPQEMTQTALFFSGQPGAGKNIMTDFLQRYVIGKRYSTQMVGVDGLASKFNACLQNKILVIVNELSTLQNKFHSDFDKIKSLITDPVITIENKGINSYQLENLANFIMFSNHEMSIKIEGGDRRYVCVRMSNEYVGNTDFFTDFVSSFHNQKAGDIVYTFLLNRKITTNTNIIPKTAFHKELQDDCLDNSIKFIFDIVPDEEGHIEYNINNEEYMTTTKDGNTIMSTNYIYSRYKNWCELRGEQAVTLCKFARNLRQRGIAKCRVTIHGKQVTAIDLGTVKR